MKNSKIYEFINALTKVELIKLGEFVRSPFFNSSNKIILLYEYISRNRNNLTDQTLSREAIFNTIYTGEKYNDQKVRILISAFLKLSENFLIFNELENKAEIKDQLLLEALENRNMSKSLKMKCNEMLNNTEDTINKDEGYYSRKISLGNLMIKMKGENIEHNLEEAYFDTLKQADHQFMIQKLKLINSLHSRKYFTFGDLNLNIWIIDEIIFEIKNNTAFYKKNHPIIYTEYLTLLMMMHPENSRYFNDLKNFILKNISLLNSRELELAYYSICNYCFNKIALNEPAYFTKLYEVYKVFESAGYYRGLKNLQHIDFASIIMAALEVPDTDWAENFLNNYSDKLLKDFKEDTLKLTSAKISYCRGRYEKAAELASSVDYRNSFLYIHSKLILIQSYYELGNTEGIAFLIDSMKHYLRRHKKILNVHYFRYLSFLNYLTKLIRLDVIKKLQLRQMIKELQEENNIANKKWLLESFKNAGQKKMMSA
jgi:hypothetical protein